MFGRVFFVLIVIVVAILANVILFYGEKTQGDFATHLNVSYDYIIVGGGSAGSVLAARLSENSDVRVLVLEAGGDDRQERMFKVPMAVPKTLRSEYDWQYFTVPQKHACKALTDERSYWPRGKVLGGSSQLNFMVYIRGHRDDYDKWAANGCDGWSYEEVLPYFKKSEDIQDETLSKSAYHGRGGNMKVTPVKPCPLVDVFLQAGKELGLNETDPNGEFQEGTSVTQTITAKGERWSASKGYLWPVIDRDNLHVAVNVHVTKILIENKMATGVEFIRNGRKDTVRASREVILSAGAVGSPHILMLSGIGPKKYLQDLKIHVYADLPVGENLQDHVQIPLRAYMNKTLSYTLDQTQSLFSMLEYVVYRTGPLASNGGEALAFVRTNLTETPDFELTMYVLLGTREVLHSMLNIKEEVLAETPWESGVGFSFMPNFLHPKSIGNIRLQNSDPFSHPLIDPAYLSDPRDAKALVRGVRYCQKLLRTKAFQKIGAKLDDFPFPTCKQFQYDTDEYWECFVRAVTITIFHPVGTCKMGAPTDPSTVVDPQLRVKGISHLRVVDGSIMPTIVSGNTHAPIVMIAEKAADLIKGR